MLCKCLRVYLRLLFLEDSSQMTVLWFVLQVCVTVKHCILLLCARVFNANNFQMCEGEGENNWKWFLGPCRAVFERCSHALC